MATVTRLTIFLVCSTFLHLLALQVNFSRSVVALEKKLPGVGFVARSVDQFKPQPLAPTVVTAEQATHEMATSVPVKKTEETQKIEVPSAEIPTPVKKVIPVLPVEKQDELLNTVAEDITLTEQTIPLAVHVKSVVDRGIPFEARTESHAAHSAVSGKSVDLAAERTVSFKKALPHYDLNPLPTYPDAARRRGLEGTVQLEVMVLTDGRVGEISLSNSSGYKSLDRAAIKAVGQWRFVPAMSLGKSVSSRVVVPIDFVLDH